MRTVHTLSHTCCLSLSCSSCVCVCVLASLWLLGKEMKIFSPSTNILYTPLGIYISSSKPNYAQGHCKNLPNQVLCRHKNTAQAETNSMSLISARTLFYGLRKHLIYRPLNMDHNNTTLTINGRAPLIHRHISLYLCCSQYVRIFVYVINC